MPDDQKTIELAALTDLVSSLRDEVRALRTEVETLRRSVPQPALASASTRPPELPGAPPASVERHIQDRSAKPPSGTLAAHCYEIVFDGGSLGNPGRGYGSYILFGAEGVIEQKKLDFADRGNAVTNNQAEYLTLISALESLADRLGADARSATVTIWGDSNLVVNQVKGSWKVKNAELAPLVQRAQAELRRLKSWAIRWHDRANSVRYLGH